MIYISSFPLAQEFISVDVSALTVCLREAEEGGVAISINSLGSWKLRNSTVRGHLLIQICNCT